MVSLINLKYIFVLFLICLHLVSYNQCSFNYISNDTLFQDYIDFIYSRKQADEIVTIGSRINRGIINDTIFNAPFFQSFDYCGNILQKRVYEYIGNNKLRHIQIPTHSIYTDEPIGNSSINTNNDEILIVDKAIDTALKKFVMILFKINETGAIKYFNTLDLDNHEANQTTIKNVLQLKDGRILAIFWDYLYEYTFYYFDENLNYLNKNTIGSTRGIGAIKETDNDEFICTSLSYNGGAFQFYRLDTTGMIKWIVTPYNGLYGLARDVFIENNKLYITGATNSFAVILFCDIDGNIIKEFKYDTFYCQPRFCGFYKESDNAFVISGYIKHCQSNDSSGTDISILKVDSNGTILWAMLYDFRNSLGTSGPNGYYTDFGGFLITKANDGSIITNGFSRYNRLVTGGLLNEDALLIKTAPIIANSNKQIFKNDIQLNLVGNLISNELTISGPVHLINNWEINSLQGKEISHGKQWSESLSIIGFESGLYVLRVFDKNNNQYFFKFVKL